MNKINIDICLLKEFYYEYTVSQKNDTALHTITSVHINQFW